MAKDPMDKFKRYDAIEVTWVDSSEIYGWQDQNTIHNIDDLIVCTVTNYLSHDDLMLHTVRCISHSQHGGLLTIPRSAIQSVKKLEAK